jgi:hypothetical protein
VRERERERERDRERQREASAMPSGKCKFHFTKEDLDENGK